MFFQQGADGQHIAQRFGHFFCAQVQHAVMKPIANIGRVIIGAAALGSLVFVMGEGKV